VTLRDLVTGPVQGDRVLITEGLKPGEKVITQGVDRLRDGVKVEVITPGKTAPGERPKGDKAKGEGKGGKGAPLS
jgi:multidrug efflux system membrane fusion protein